MAKIIDFKHARLRKEAAAREERARAFLDRLRNRSTMPAPPTEDQDLETLFDWDELMGRDSE